MNPTASPLHRRGPLWGAAIVAGLLLGLASAWWAVKHAASLGQAAGPWRVSLLAGSAQADALTRARVAFGGLLALNREETMYFVAAADSAGAPLRTRCAYRVSGTPPEARWWSLTAYADDFFLFADDQHRYSVNGATAALDAQGRFSVLTGPQPPAAGPGAAVPWLPTPGDRGLVLTLRVYNPSAALQARPQQMQPPRIEPVGACA